VSVSVFSIHGLVIGHSHEPAKLSSFKSSSVSFYSLGLTLGLVSSVSQCPVPAVLSIFVTPPIVLCFHCCGLIVVVEECTR